MMPRISVTIMEDGRVIHYWMCCEDSATRVCWCRGGCGRVGQRGVRVDRKGLGWPAVWTELPLIDRNKVGRLPETAETVASDNRLIWCLRSPVNTCFKMQWCHVPWSHFSLGHSATHLVCVYWRFARFTGQNIPQVISHLGENTFLLWSSVSL